MKRIVIEYDVLMAKHMEVVMKNMKDLKMKKNPHKIFMINLTENSMKNMMAVPLLE